ncbi:MAG: hypothetical protein WBM74_05160, partial [Polyangiales bacterium]
WGYIETHTATHLDEKLDEVCAITWCLGRKPYPPRAPKTAAPPRARRAKPGANAPARQTEANAAPGTLLTRVRVIPGLRVGAGGRCN